LWPAPHAAPVFLELDLLFFRAPFLILTAVRGSMRFFPSLQCDPPFAPPFVILLAQDSLKADWFLLLGDFSLAPVRCCHGPGNFPSYHPKVAWSLFPLRSSRLERLLFLSLLGFFRPSGPTVDVPEVLYVIFFWHF